MMFLKKKPYFLFFLFLLSQGPYEGAIKINGSSTLYPLQEAVAEEFQKEHPRIRISIGISGTGGGVQKFIKEEADVIGASRPMTEEELRLAPNHEKILVAYDGITLIVHPKNPIDSLSLSDLHNIWKSGSTVFYWNHIPNGTSLHKVRLYGPDPDSGTFDFFTQKINKETKSIRKDYSPNDNDQMLVKAIIQDEFGLGYLGYPYYKENKASLKALRIEGILPSEDSIRSGQYPLCRPLFLYVNVKSLSKHHVDEFIKFYKKKSSELASEVGLVANLGSKL